MKSRGSILAGILSVSALIATPVRPAEPGTTESAVQKVRWLKGPAEGQLGTLAHVTVPPGFVFADAADTRTLMESMENPVSNTELGFLAPEDLKWFVVFEFDDVGYVRDDEKTRLDADAMLKSLIASNDKANDERRKRNWSVLQITGWEQPPAYNPTTHNLEWAIRGLVTGKSIVNRNTRLLGRTGVMKVTLVGAPETLQSVYPRYDGLLANCEFNSGLRYEQMRAGDKVAEYGLTALVVGGATAVAAKSGLLKWIWKGIVVAAVALFGLIKRILGAISGRSRSEAGTPG